MGWGRPVCDRHAEGRIDHDTRTVHHRHCHEGVGGGGGKGEARAEVEAKAEAGAEAEAEAEAEAGAEAEAEAKAREIKALRASAGRRAPPPRRVSVEAGSRTPAAVSISQLLR